MAWLLNLIYLLLLVLASPYLAWAALRHGKYRDGLAAKLLGRVPHRDPAHPCVWLHAVSVGEVNLLEPLLRRLEEEHPECECVISTTTRTGFDLARRKYAPRTIFYCPLDFSWAVRKALTRIQPDVLILAELELWPNLIRIARRRGVRVAVINGRLSENSARGYRKIRFFIAGLLKSLNLLAVQDHEYARRFLQLGADPAIVEVTGSLKFDGAETDRGNPATRKLADLWEIQADEVVWLAGSTQHPEEQVAIEAFGRLRDEFPKLRLILVPRHPERFEDVAHLLEHSGHAWQRRSELDCQATRGDAGEPGAQPDGAQPDGAQPDGAQPDGATDTECQSPPRTAPARVAPARVLLVDAIGELQAWWGTAGVAFVGGSLGRRGGQNMIEPAGYGAAVSFGPNTRNFRDIVGMMLERDAATVVTDVETLTQFVRRCLEHPSYADKLGTRARQLVLEQLGATDRTYQLLRPLLGLDGPRSDRDGRVSDHSSRSRDLPR